jgi:hypothetical protein
MMTDSLALLGRMQQVFEVYHQQISMSSSLDTLDFPYLLRIVTTLLSSFIQRTGNDKSVPKKTWCEVGCNATSMPTLVIVPVSDLEC